MSQHALKLAEAASALLDGHNLYVAGAGPLNECVSTENFAALRETLAAYLASDEHAIDLQRAQASALGFQGLAGKPNPK